MEPNPQVVPRKKSRRSSICFINQFLPSLMDCRDTCTVISIRHSIDINEFTKIKKKPAQIVHTVLLRVSTERRQFVITGIAL